MKYLDATYLATRPSPLSQRDAGEGCVRDSSAPIRPMYAPFILLIRWMLGWAVYGYDIDSFDIEDGQDAPIYAPRHPWRYLSRPYNRQERRTPVRPALPGNNLRPFYVLVGQSRTKRQFLEKVSRISAINRINLYGFRYWHKKRLSMTKLSPFYFGGWHAPHSENQSDGLWDAQALPG